MSFEYSKELDIATRKYYYYCNKYDKCKSGAKMKRFLADKREFYRQLGSDLFIKEYSDYCGWEVGIPSSS